MRRNKLFHPGLNKRLGALGLAVSLVAGSLSMDSQAASAASSSWKTDVEAALDQMTDALGRKDTFTDAQTSLEEAFVSLESSETVENLAVTAVTADSVTLEWSAFTSETLAGYNVYWADKNEEGTNFLLMDQDSKNAANEQVITIPAESLDKNEAVVTFKVYKTTNKNYFFKVAPVTSAGVGSKTDAVMSPTAVAYDSYLEGLSRGLTAALTKDGVYLNWRLLADEVDGYNETGLTGVDFHVYREGKLIARVTDSTNFLDGENKEKLNADTYKIVPLSPGTDVELTDQSCTAFDLFTADSENTNVAYKDIPLQVPSKTTFRDTYNISEMALAGYTMTDGGYTSVDADITYSANDMSPADVDGDGDYEFLLQWEPSFSKDVSQQGYTGKTYIDCYEADGTLRWRLDLGINIRAGAHYTEFGAFDYDGDGKAELIVKTAPGTKMIRYQLDETGRNVPNQDGSLKIASEDYVTIPREDLAEGVTDSSDFVFSADEYREYLIGIFQDWGIWSRYSPKTVEDAIQGHWSGNLVELLSVSADYSDSTFYTGEVSKSANVTFGVGSMSADQIRQYVPEYQEGDTLVNVCLRDENGGIRYVSADAGVNPVMKTVRLQDVDQYFGSYDLESCNFDATGKGYTEAEAALLADYYLKHYEYRMKKHSLETWEGYIITGPEYVSLFDCENGAELDTQDWFYEREDDGMLWGDYAMNYIEPGNRNDRFNVAVAYLDGSTPSCIMGRGYYTRTTMAAYNVVDKKLKVAGNIDSGWTVMTNPFNDGPHGFDGCDPENGTLSGQGDHYIAVADVDGDGRQDIVNGGAIVSWADGQLYLYSSGGDYLGGGTGKDWAKYGHGDSIHITDIDPDRPGLEILSCFEGGAWAPYNWAMRDARTNTVIFGEPGTQDFGRITIGDVLKDVRGLEISTGRDAKGNQVSLTGVSTNMNIKWSPDMSTQFVTGTDKTQIIGNVNGKSQVFLNAPAYSTNNSTKGNPGLVADVYGDYREEIILRAGDSSHLRIFMNTEESEHKNYTLMHNLQYRAGIASQNSSYNQPAYTDYYYASDTDWAYVTVPNQPAQQEPGKVEVQPAGVTINATSRTLKEGETLKLQASVLPAAASQEVTWTSEDEKIAAVDADGLVTAVAEGTVNITASAANGKTSACRISVLGKYQEDGLDQFAVGDTVNYTFGTSGKVKAETVYRKEAGYGWVQPSKVTLTDGKDYVAGNNYRTAGSGAGVVYEYPSFTVDVPVGIYDVTIVQGTNGTDKAVNGAYVEGNMYSVRWSTESFATAFTEPGESSYIWTAAGETKETSVTTAVADGQLTIELASWLKDSGESGTTYIKEISITRKQQNTEYSQNPTLRFIGDSTLAKYPPEDNGTWTPIPERTGWGEEFSMGKFVDDEMVLVNKAVAGSSLKSYVYDGFYNEFFLNSRPGDTVIIESGINDSAAGRRYSNDAEFEERLRCLIKSCEAFGLDVIISSGTSSGTNYTAKMTALAEECKVPYVDLLNLWNDYLTKTGNKSGNVTVDGTHLNRVGGVVAAQLVAGEIAGLEGLYISGHVKEVPITLTAPTASVTGLYAKAQTQNSLTLAWNIGEDTLYEQDQLITGFNVYRKAKGSSGSYEPVVSQTAYVSAGMTGPQLQASFETPEKGAYTYYVTCKGLTGEGPASGSVDVTEYAPSAAESILSLIGQFNTQLYDASVYTVESYANVKASLEKAQTMLDQGEAAEEELKACLLEIQTAADGLELNAAALEQNDFQKEPIKSAPWGAGGNHSGLLSNIMEEDGNRMLKLYVEASGARYVNKTFADAASVNAETAEVKFVWYPGQPDRRNCTELEFFSNDSNRLLSLKTSNNGHIGYVAGNYPADNRYLTGDGFHSYEDSKAVDLGLTNEAWYNVKIIFHFGDSTADLFIEPRDDTSLSGAERKGIQITTDKNTVSKLNFLLMRGRTDGDAGNDLSLLWNTYLDDFAIHYTDKKQTIDKTAWEKALAEYHLAVDGLNSTVLSGEEFVLAKAVADIMPEDIGFFTQKDYDYGVGILKAAADAAPEKAGTASVTLNAENTFLTAGLTASVTAALSEGANEELVWTVSDKEIATVDSRGTSAVVTARKAGKVTITAAGASSGKEGSIELNITGKAYFFGSDVAADSAYDSSVGFGFHNYTYPSAAAGWKDGVYYPRELSKETGASYVTDTGSTGYLGVKSQVWTEKAEGADRDEDIITYENTSSFDADMANGNITVSVTFCNPTKTVMNVCVKAEDIRRFNFGDHDTNQIAQASIQPGQTKSVSFPLALNDGQLSLRFEQNSTDSSYESAAARTVYVKSVSVDEYKTEKRDKTAVLVMGDSTVQTYTDTANYRTGWGQRLPALFGSLEDSSLTETQLGYAFYETEDTTVINYARDGRSARSFLEEGRLNKALLNIQEGDYVFLQFAHNDDNSARVNRFLSIEDYKKYLEAYHDAVAQRGGTLVLVTPIVLNVWENGGLDHRFDDYRMAMMDVAEGLNIPLLDLMGSSLELVTQMGKTSVDKLGMYMSDGVHTKMAGADLFAGLLGNLLNASEHDGLADLKELMNTAVKTDKIAITSIPQLDVGEKASVTVTAQDQNAVVTLYSSDENIISITDGRLEAKAPGRAVITAGYVTGDTVSGKCTAYTDYQIVTVAGGNIEKTDAAGKPDNIEAQDNSGKSDDDRTNGAGESEDTEKKDDAGTSDDAGRSNVSEGSDDTGRPGNAVKKGIRFGAVKDAEPDDGKTALNTGLMREETVSARLPVLAAQANDDNKAGILEQVTVFTDASVPGMQPSPIEKYQYDFGTRKGNAGAPFTTISNQAYDAAKGYGFISGIDGMVFDKHDDTSIIANGESDYDKAIAAALSDAARNGAWEFAVDVPAGEYMVSIYAYDTWNGASDKAQYFINDVLVGTYDYEKGVSRTVDQCAMSARVVVSEDSQIVIKGVKDKTLAYLSAITFSEYVEKVDDCLPEEWKALEEAMAVLGVKTSAFEETSTPFDYDVSLVNKMMAVMDGVDNVRYMQLADTTAGDAVYKSAEEAVADKLLYTESSIEKLENAMKAYTEAKVLLDVKADRNNLFDTLEYWLQGVKTEGIETAYSLYADFESVQTGGSSYNNDLAYKAPGWTSVGTAADHPYLTAYSAETGYGMLEAAAGRNRGTGNALLDDFILGGTFAFDLPAGDYRVITYTGDLMTGCKGASSYQFYTDYNTTDKTGNLIAGSADKITAGEAGYVTTPYTFTLIEGTTVTMAASGHTQAVIIEQVIPATVQKFDIDKLKELVSSIDAAGLDEADYTLSSWAALDTAMDAAVKTIAEGPTFAQQMEKVYKDLEAAYAKLVLRTAVREYALDFGPADENGTPAKVWDGAPVLSSFQTMNKNEVELGLGTMLYESNTDDNGIHYGFTKETASGFTATGGNYFRDYVYGAGGSEYTFKADLPAGYYYVYVYTGSKEAANTTQFYFNKGEAASETVNTAAAQDGEGRTIYTQNSNAGGQFTAPGCIYKVKVLKSRDALSAVKGTDMGTFSITLFNHDDSLAEDAVTARLNGIEICFAGELSGEDVSGGDVTDGDVTDGDVTDGDVTGGDREVNKKDLQGAADRAGLLSGEKYTQDSFAVLTAALEQARAVLADEKATQTAVDGALKALNEAIAALTEKPQADKTALAGVIEAAEAVEDGKYTGESYTVLLNALKEARQVMAAENADQEEVDAATAALQAAIAALVMKPEVPGQPENPDLPGQPENPGDNPGNSGGSPSEPEVDWDHVDSTVTDTVQEAIKSKNVPNGPAQSPVLNIVTGSKILVPAQIFKTIKNQNVTVAFHTGNGITFSIGGNQRMEKALGSGINLSVLPGKEPVPASVSAEKTAGSVLNRQISMASKDYFGMTVNLHLSLGKDHAAKFANLYLYNQQRKKLEWKGSFRITETGQAMFGIQKGGDYLVTVTGTRPDEEAERIEIQKGDTLSRIAAKYQISMEDLMAVNPEISDRNRIKAGQKILIR